MTDCRVARRPVRGDLCERPDSRRRCRIVTTSRQRYTTVAAIYCYTAYSKNVTACCRRRWSSCVYEVSQKNDGLISRKLVSFTDRQRTSCILRRRTVHMFTSHLAYTLASCIWWKRSAAGEVTVALRRGGHASLTQCYNTHPFGATSLCALMYAYIY